MKDFESRGAPLEYWFLKFNSGPLAFLVDFIVRRRHHQAEVRLSLWVQGTGRVEHAYSSSWRTNPTTVAIAGCELSSGASHGAVADIEWQLGYEAVRPGSTPLPWRSSCCAHWTCICSAAPRHGSKDRSRWARSGSPSPTLAARSTTTWGFDCPSAGAGSRPATSGVRTARWRRCCCSHGCGAYPAPTGHRLLLRDPGRSDPHAHLAAHRPHTLTRKPA
jgi:hypothetical protein